jgi:SAM-dependent methyltransferase
MDSIHHAPAEGSEPPRRSEHRVEVGGLWDEMGRLQLDFLVAHGLRPEQHLLDIGCGSLRAGVKLIPYLEPGHYWGVDHNEALLQAGWEMELGPLGLQSRQPRQQLVALSDFQFERLSRRFDVAIAQSVFTHMPFNRIRRCLVRLAPQMNAGGRFYATFFEVAASSECEAPVVHQPGGITTFSDRDPYHYRLRDFEYAIEELPWRIQYIGEWGHPRDQRMLSFEFRSSAQPSATAITGSRG